MIKKTLLASAVAATCLALGAAPATSQSGGTRTYADVADGRVMISPGERAMATQQVQNLMSKHEFYHSAGMNLESVDDLWVSPDGIYADTATFGSPIWVMYGLQTVRNAYGLQNQANRQAALEAINEVDPSVEVTEENLGAGHEWVMHTSTTPIIEIAGDGKTAKGIWYSPGLGIMANVTDGKIGAQGSMFWEKYAGDFVLEDGIWKIWHLQMAYDFVPGLPQEMMDRVLGSLGDMAYRPEESGRMLQAGERPDFELPPGFRAPLYSYPDYSPQRPGIIYPQFPEPYYTFSETFTFCNCDQELPF